MRVEQGEAARVHTGEGRIIAITDATNEAWALSQRRRAGVGSDYFLMHSSDAGRTWEDEGPILLPDLDQLVAVDDQELWVLGAELGRSLDGGITWKVVAAPGKRSMVQERLQAEEGAIVLLGETVRRSTDAGRTWQEQAPGARVTAADPRWWAGTRSGEAVFARRGESDWQPLPLPATARPVRMYSDESVLRVVATPPADQVAAGIYVLESKDHGASWAVERQGADGYWPNWDMGPAGGLFSYDPLTRDMLIRP